MATIYIDNIFELYDTDTHKWCRDDIPVQLKELIESGMQLKICSWNDNNPEFHTPAWLKDEQYSINSEDLSMLGYVEQVHPDSIIITKNDNNYPLHATRNYSVYFGTNDLNVSIPDLVRSLNADILFVPIDFDAAIGLITSNPASYENINSVYITENSTSLLTAGVDGPLIVFTSEEEIIPISHSTQLVINKARNLGCVYRAQYGNKKVVITDGSIDAEFFDLSISLFFKSSI